MTHNSSSTLTIFSFFLLILFAVSSSNYKQQKVYRIVPTNPIELQALVDLMQLPNDAIDFWKEPVAIGLPVDIRIINQSEFDRITITQNNVHFQKMEVMIDDIDKLISNQFDGNSRLRNHTTFSSVPSFICYDEYMNYDDIVRYLNDLVSQFPTISRIITIGKSLQNRDIFGVRIVVPGGNRRGIYIDSAIHSREWIATAVNLNILLNLLNGYVDGDLEVVRLLNTFEVTIVPVLNVDGYVFTWTNNRMWRKTRRPNSGGSFGVDMNRNADVEFCQKGSSNVPSSDTYCGPFANSEPELVATFDYIKTTQNILIYWNLHSYGQEIIIPFAYDNSIITPDRLDHLDAGDLLWEEINLATGYNYDGPRPPNGIYSGFAMDYIYIQLGVKYSGLIELRDTGRYGFVLPESQICDNSREIWEGFKLHSLFAATKP